MLTVRTVFLTVFVLIVALELVFSGIIGDLLNLNRCRRRNPSATCKYFCDINECDEGDCVCKSDWRSDLSKCSVSGVRPGCERTAERHETSCPYMCIPKRKDPDNKTRAYCVVWHGSGPCAAPDVNENTNNRKTDIPQEVLLFDPK